MGFLFGSNLDVGGGFGFGAARSTERPFYNGMDVSKYLLTGGPVTAADANAVLQAGVTDIPSVEGARYATTAQCQQCLKPKGVFYKWQRIM